MTSEKMAMLQPLEPIVAAKSIVSTWPGMGVQMAKGRQIALTPLDCACGWVSAGDDVLFLHAEACDAQFHFVTGFQVGFGCLAHAHTWGGTGGDHIARLQ